MRAVTPGTGRNPDDDDENKVLMNGIPFSTFDELVAFLVNNLKVPTTDHHQTVTVTACGGGPAATTTNEQTAVPVEIARNVGSWFTIRPVDPTCVRATRCSSSMSQQCDLSKCLEDNERTWWISGIDSFQSNGQGEEWVEFVIGSTLKRVSAVHIKIPPLPYGPLSVRTMRIDTKDSRGGNDGWMPSTSVLTVENRSGWQRIATFDPIDASEVRLVCLSNQASQFYNDDEHEHERFRSVGFFCVRFE